MPSRAFDVLLTLVECRGTVVSKETLLAATWGDVSVEENTLVQAISALRRALRDASGDDSTLITIPGRGYQFTGAVRVPSLTRRRHFAAAVVLTTAVVGGTAVLGWPSHRFHFWEDHCVAVIPFETLGRPAVAGVAIADGLIVKLAARDRLRVRPTSAILGLPARDYRRLGAALKVDRIIAGTIQDTKDGVRVTVQLIDVNKEAAVWAASFDESARGAGPSDLLLSRIADAVRPRMF
jgi:TolB-like protein